MILCRSDRAIPVSVKKKISLFCSVPQSNVVEARDVDTIYEVPLRLYKQDVGQIIAEQLQLGGKSADISKLELFIERFKNPTHELTIGLCGKYTELPDAYKSVIEAFIHSGVENDARVHIRWINTELLNSDEESEEHLGELDGILVLPGFGDRGTEGKLSLIHI